MIHLVMSLRRKYEEFSTISSNHEKAVCADVLVDLWSLPGSQPGPTDELTERSCVKQSGEAAVLDSHTGAQPMAYAAAQTASPQIAARAPTHGAIRLRPFLHDFTESPKTRQGRKHFKK